MTFDFGRPLAEARDGLTPRELALYADVVEEVRALYGERLRSLKLVGSRARGAATERSDHDLLVFLDACDWEVEGPALQHVSDRLTLKHGLGDVSLSPLSAEQFLGLDAKYDGITDRFRRDAITLWPPVGEA